MNEVFGGYTDIKLNRDKKWLKGDKNSFLFSLSKNTRHDCIDGEKEVFGDYHSYMVFGKGQDLIIFSINDK